jgi:hypothetical protein
MGGEIMIHNKFLALILASSACLFFIFCDQTKSEVPAKVKELLLKAIEVHGGMDRLSKHRADSVKTKGLDQLKTSQEIEVKGKSFRVVQICNKGEVVMQIDNKQQKAEPAIAQQIQDTLRLAVLIRLIPLLDNSALKFEDLGSVIVSERPARAIRVKEKDRPDIVLVFDEQSGFLIKSELVRQFEKKQVVQEDFFSDFRDISGFKRPVKLQSFRNGKKILDAELIEVRYFEKLDPSVFKP